MYSQSNHEEFSIDHMVMPPRSRLFHPKVMGNAAKDVEGLISYIVRIAAAHSVSPMRLLRKIYASENPELKDFLYPSFFNQYSSTVNGLGKYAELFVKTTESLTYNKSLSLMTLLPLSNLLPSTGCGLLADRPKWCPECIQDMLDTYNQSYRPLIWSLKLYRGCTTHNEPLVDTCPHCKRFQPFIPRYPDLSRCAYCYQGLNIRKLGETVQLSEFDYWVLAVIEDLIGNLDQLGQIASAEYFVAFLIKAINHYAGGNRAKFCKVIGLNSWAMKGWLTKNEKPSLPQLLTICYGIDVLPSKLFLNPWDEVFTGHTLRHIPEKIAVRAERPLLVDNQIAELNKLITAIANNETDHRPLAVIAKQLGQTLSCLKYWFPTECAKISGKYAAHKKHTGIQNAQAAVTTILTIINDLKQKGECVSNRKVNNRLLKVGMSLAKPALYKTFISEAKVNKK